MTSLYDRADIYDLFDNENSFLAYQKHWAAILANKTIHSFLDVSIGSGSVTLPLAETRMKLYGSDLSKTMLTNCQKKAAKKGYTIDLRCCDFRELTQHFEQKFDCVASTGNSLPHVKNEDVLKTLEQMDALVEDGCYLYFDMRNWDKILCEKNRFYLYNPVFEGSTRINLIQVWDYHTDASITFHLLYTFEQNNQIFHKEKFDELYYPVKKALLLDKLKQLGYKNIETHFFPATSEKGNPDDADWYCIIAQKSKTSQ